MIPNNHQVPLIGKQQDRAKQALAEQLQAMAAGIYVQSAARVMADPELAGVATSDDMQKLARHCAQAARDYFEGLGVAQFNPPK